MSYYKQNLKSLKKYRSNILDALNNEEMSSMDPKVDQVFTELAINQEKVLMIKKMGKEFRVNSSYNPSHEARIWAEQFKLSNINNVIVMFGFGNGYFAKELASKLKKNDFLIIYEPSHEIFSHVLQEYDISALLVNKNIIFSIEGLNDFDFHNLLQNIVHITNMSTQIQCSHPFYEELFPDSCVKYWKEIKDTMIHTKINANTEILFGRRLIANGFRNLKQLKNCNILEDFAEDIKRDIPAIVVAAGPSLKENINELKRIQGKAYIFVVDRILDYVLDNGLEPDFVVTIDPIKPVEYFTVREEVKIPLLCEMVSNSDVLDIHKGRKIFYNCNGFFQKMYDKAGKNPPRLQTGASVATAAFSICIKLGFDKIVLVGQDLAYDGQYTHAGEIAENFDDGADDIIIEGIGGQKVRSRYDWYEFLVWFKDIISLNTQIRVFDTKKKGALIQGTELMSLTEIIDQFCSEQTGFGQLISNKQVTFHSQDLKLLHKFFEDSEEELLSLKKKAEEAMQLCDLLIEAYGRQSEDNEYTMKNNKKLSKLNKAMYSKPVYQLLDSYITSLTANYIAKLYQLSEDVKSDMIETYEKSKKIYEAIIDGVDYALPLLKAELKQLNSK